EVAGVYGHAWHLIIRHRDYHVLGLESLFAGGYDEPAIFLPQPVDLYPVSHRQAGAPRVLDEVISYLILRRKTVAAGRKTRPRKSGVSRGAEKTKGVPAVSPGVADARVGIENQERKPALRQIVSDRESCLTTSDDDGLNSMDALNAVHLNHLTDLALASS